MKKLNHISTWITLTTSLLALSSFGTIIQPEETVLRHGDDQLKKEALEILETRCNVCHRKKNPFMIFNNRNMSKRSSKIYRMVFVEKKMPKGNEVRLTHEEYVKLEKWLLTQKIY